MPTIIDTHVHIHPGVDLAVVLSAALKNSEKIQNVKNSGACGLVLCLTEREGEDFFKGIAHYAGQVVLGRGLVCEEIIDNKIAKLLWQNRQTIYLVSGRQIVTQEKIEVLALGFNGTIKDGSKVEEVISLINKANGLAVLPWSPGKWLFRRGKILKGIFEKYSEKDIAVGDISMRPRICIGPKLMRKAASRGIRILNGSDPLPISGDENVIASYCIYSEDDIDASDIAGSISRILRSAELSSVGRRNSLFTASKRWVKVKLTKK